MNPILLLVLLLLSGGGGFCLGGPAIEGGGLGLILFVCRNMNAESKRAVKQGHACYSKPIPWLSPTGLCVTLMAMALFLAAPCAKAQTKLATADKTFILAAAEGGMTEVKLGELAARKGTRNDVKEFGQMMVKDHTAINDDLKSLAQQKGVALPDSLDTKHQGMVDKMAALTGADFDNAYIAAMLKGHKADADAFKSESVETQDSDIKGFVDKSFPIVTQHLEQISSMKK